MKKRCRPENLAEKSPAADSLLPTLVRVGSLPQIARSLEQRALGTTPDPEQRSTAQLSMRTTNHNAGENRVPDERVRKWAGRVGRSVERGGNTRAVGPDRSREALDILAASLNQ